MITMKMMLVNGILIQVLMMGYGNLINMMMVNGNPIMREMIIGNPMIMIIIMGNGNLIIKIMEDGNLHQQHSNHQHLLKLVM